MAGDLCVARHVTNSTELIVIQLKGKQLNELKEHWDVSIEVSRAHFFPANGISLDFHERTGSATFDLKAPKKMACGSLAQKNDISGIVIRTMCICQVFKQFWKREKKTLR